MVIQVDFFLQKKHLNLTTIHHLKIFKFRNKTVIVGICKIKSGFVQMKIQFQNFPFKLLLTMEIYESYECTIILIMIVFFYKKCYICFYISVNETLFSYSCIDVYCIFNYSYTLFEIQLRYSILISFLKFHELFKIFFKLFLNNNNKKS